MTLSSVTYRRADGSFLGVVNGYPYHVTADDPLFARAQQIGAAAPMEPAPTRPTPEQALTAWRARAKVSAFQALAALEAAGLLASATALVEAQGGVTKLAWDRAVEFRRNSPTINALAGALGLSATQLDDLFIAAAVIEA